jgi:hypothetical protein
MFSCNKPHEVVEEPAVQVPVVAEPLQPPLDTTMFVVLPFEKASGYLLKNAKAASLSNEEIHVVENLLEKCIAEHNEAQEKDYQDAVNEFPEIQLRKKNYFISLPDYKRQLIAVTNAKGEKEVWVNCFCHDESYWRQEVVSVDDGGNCFFNVKINLAKKTYYDMMVNGSA